jgi:hypothetical protein
MPRNRNVASTARLPLSTTPQVIALLEQLARIGLFGKNGSEVAEQLLRERLLALVREGVLKMPGRGRR